MILEVSKCHPDAKLPVRAHKWDAGADVFSLEHHWIAPGCNKVIKTGLRISVPPGHMVQVMNKSSIASKRGLLVGACVIDPGYTGELMIDLHNVGDSSTRGADDLATQFVEINPGDKIAQIVVIPVEHVSFVELTTEQFDNLPKFTARGDGGFGSTGAK